MSKRFVNLIAFSDIHGNAEALKAILPTINKFNADYVLCAGDLIGIGPSNNDVIELVEKIANFYCVRGNHENYYIYGYSSSTSAFENEHHNWIKNSINPKYSSYLSNLPYTIYFNINNKKIALVHYALEKNGFMLIKHNLNKNELDKMFSNIDADIILYGHEHKNSIVYGKKLYIDIGTLGCSNINPGFARFIQLRISEEKVLINEFLINYQILPEIEKMDKQNMPDKEMIKSVFFKQTL